MHGLYALYLLFTESLCVRSEPTLQSANAGGVQAAARTRRETHSKRQAFHGPFGGRGTQRFPDHKQVSGRYHKRCQSSERETSELKSINAQPDNNILNVCTKQFTESFAYYACLNKQKCHQAFIPLTCFLQ